MYTSLASCARILKSYNISGMAWSRWDGVNANPVYCPNFSPFGHSVGSKMWNDLSIELKSDPRISLTVFVKNKLNKSFKTNYKYGGVFVYG